MSGVYVDWEQFYKQTPNLAVLSLRNDYLSGPFPYTIGNLKALQFLDLSYNYMTGSLPDSLGWFEHLKHLWLGFNLFSGYLPWTLQSATQLENL